MRSHWYETSERRINAALDALPPGADEKAIVKAVREAYPFGPRQHHPYKQWLKAQRQILHKRFPAIFPSERTKAMEPGEGLFSTEVSP